MIFMVSDYIAIDHQLIYLQRTFSITKKNIDKILYKDFTVFLFKMFIVLFVKVLSNVRCCTWKKKKIFVVFMTKYYNLKKNIYAQKYSILYVPVNWCINFVAYTYYLKTVIISILKVYICSAGLKPISQWEGNWPTSTSFSFA